MWVEALANRFREVTQPWIYGLKRPALDARSPIGTGSAKLVSLCFGRDEGVLKMKVTSNRWQNARYDLVETGWFDLENRPKSLRAVEKIVGRISDEELETLTEKVTIVFAPSPYIDGEVLPLFASAATPKTVPELPAGVSWDNAEDRKTCFVYLAPHLERKSQPYVDSVVAHEFAHVLLHPFQGPSAGIEAEADAKIQRWGFEPAYTEKDLRRIPGGSRSGTGQGQQ